MHVDTLGRETDGPLFEAGGNRIKLQVLDENVVRLVYTAGEAIPDAESPMVVEQEPSDEWDLIERERSSNSAPANCASNSTARPARSPGATSTGGAS
ncbi:hypothetical protein ACFQL4_13370 [Halosimplex aquaticum]